MYADIFEILKIMLQGHVSEETSKQLYDVSVAIHIGFDGLAQYLLFFQ